MLISSNCQCKICPESLPVCGHVLTIFRQDSCKGRFNCLCCFAGRWRPSSPPSRERLYLAGPTWPPGRIWLSPRFLPPCPSGERCLSRPLPYRSFLHFPVVQGAGFELVESCGLCFFWLPYLLVLPCCCCISPVGLHAACRQACCCSLVSVSNCI